MADLKYRTVTPENWDEAKHMLSSLSVRWIFRGQHEARWGLRHSLERVSPDGRERENEEALISAFMRAAHHYLEATTLPETRLEKMALMQHHGAPSRLLDWTRSAYVAAFIALEDSDPERHKMSAVWAVNLKWVREQAAEAVRRNFPEYADMPNDVDFNDAELFDKVLMQERVAMVAPVEPFRLNQRMITQQATFLVPGKVGISFIENLAAFDQSSGDGKEKLLKFELPTEWRGEALRDLDTMNINFATLFPGLDGFARSLRLVTDAIADDRYVRALEEKKRGFGFDAE